MSTIQHPSYRRTPPDPYYPEIGEVFIDSDNDILMRIDADDTDTPNTDRAVVLASVTSRRGELYQMSMCDNIAPYIGTLVVS